jgi:phage gpG-like protein
MGAAIKNISAFNDLKRRVTAVAHSSAMLDELGKRTGAALMKQVSDEFRESRDPYGKAWAPVVRDRGRDRRARAKRTAAGKKPKADKPLIDTGRMRASVTAKVTGSDVRIVIPVNYASYHQDPKPGSHNVRRQMLPEADTGGLGDRWRMAINKEAAAVLQKHFGGKGKT